jgi:hypothetical protein
MFSDFDNRSKNDEGRGRMGASFALSAIVFGAIAAVLATAVATAHVVRRPPDIDVEFAAIAPAPAPPEPEVAPPPPPPPPRRRRAGSVSGHARIGPPTEIPDEQPAEAEGELGDEPGDGEGAFDGPGEGGDEDRVVPPAPPPPVESPEPPRTSPSQERESVSPPRFLSGCSAPEAPSALNAQAATIRIEVRFLVSIEGRVENARVVERHELVDDELLLACIREQRYAPAALPDGTAVPYPLRRRFVFRPANI